MPVVTSIRNYVRKVQSAGPVAAKASTGPIRALLAAAGATMHAGPVTVVPAGGLLGMCFTGQAPRPTAAEFRHLGGPYPLLPARLRRRHETYPMALFAGQIAEDAYSAPGDTLAPVPDVPVEE